ncbi:hypothetical protein [Streptomyces sp. NPDC091268]|uniref:hypothetical protein n=1 Tax=Streptomyces sp. NPDC091268 TaxID=3365979 RepID=UPI003822B715
MGILPSGFFDPIESEIASPWANVPAKVAVLSVLVFLAVESVRQVAIVFWSRVSMRIERRAWSEDLVKSAQVVGVDIRVPGWRRRMPASVFKLPKKTPRRLFHYIRARRLCRSVSSRKFRTMAARRNQVGMLSELPMRIVRVFSRRSVILGTAVFLVYDYERPGTWGSDLDRCVSMLSRLAEQRTWIPVLVLLAGVLAASRSSPLVDRVRARDEAAKDANRMLTELLAKLRELQVAVRLCHETLPSYRQSYFDTLCGPYQRRSVWSPEGGIQPDHMFRVGFSGKEFDEPEFQRARTATEAVNAQLNAIRDKGLASVVFRMLSPVSTALWDCGFHRELSFSWRLRESKVSTFDCDWMARRNENIEKRMSRGRGNEPPCRLDVTLVHEAYQVDDLILRSMLNEFQLERICTFLQKRIHGTTLTRLLGGAGAK